MFLVQSDFKFVSVYEPENLFISCSSQLFLFVKSIERSVKCTVAELAVRSFSYFVRMKHRVFSFGVSRRDTNNKAIDEYQLWISYARIISQSAGLDIACAPSLKLNIDCGG